MAKLIVISVLILTYNIGVTAAAGSVVRGLLNNRRRTASKEDSVFNDENMQPEGIALFSSFSKTKSGGRGGKGGGKGGGKKQMTKAPTPSPTRPPTPAPTPAPTPVCPSAPDEVAYDLFLNFETNDPNLEERTRDDIEGISELVKDILVESECRALSNESCLSRCIEAVNFEGLYDKFSESVDSSISIDQPVSLEFCNDRSRLLQNSPIRNTQDTSTASISSSPSQQGTQALTFNFSIFFKIIFRCFGCVQGLLLNDASRRHLPELTDDSSLPPDLCDFDKIELPPILDTIEFENILQEELVQNDYGYLSDILEQVSEEAPVLPSESPSLSKNPSSSPSSKPSRSPSSTPTLSSMPSLSPTETPSKDPSSNPTVSIAPTSAPSDSPSKDPSSNPTLSVAPTSAPSDSPSKDPSSNPTLSVAPTSVPSDFPSKDPSSNPTLSVAPTSTPSDSPSKDPSSNPTLSVAPTSAPSDSPSRDPSSNPTLSIAPTSAPSDSPSKDPSSNPTLSAAPTSAPTALPSVDPSSKPSVSSAPSSAPSFSPSDSPSTTPSLSLVPSSSPSLPCQNNPPDWFTIGISDTPRDCAWYEEDVDERCSAYGEEVDSSSFTANEACCACGGGCNDDRLKTVYVEDTGRGEPCVWLAARLDVFSVSLDNYYSVLCEDDDGFGGICPETCGKCYDTVFDTDGYFMYDKKLRTCLWLSLRPNVQDELCQDRNSEAFKTCPESCTLFSACDDDPMFKDVNGRDCAWYQNARYNNCKKAGDLANDLNVTANEACCVCGGGADKGNNI